MTAEEFIGNLQHGEVASQLEQALLDTGAACARTGKPGTVTLTITIRPNPANGRAMVDAQVTEKQPKPATEPTLFFLSSGGALSRKDPQQSIYDLDTFQRKDTDQ